MSCELQWLIFLLVRETFTQLNLEFSIVLSELTIVHKFENTGTTSALRPSRLIYMEQIYALNRINAIHCSIVSNIESMQFPCLHYSNKLSIFLKSNYLPFFVFQYVQTFWVKTIQKK